MERDFSYRYVYVNQSINKSVQFPNDHEVLVSSEIFIVISVFLSVIFFIGLTGNSFCLYVFFRTKSLWTTNNFFIAGLLLCDWSQSVFGIPVVVLTSWAQKWIFGHSVCIYYGFITTCFGLTQITLLTAISLDKYFLIVRQAQMANFGKKQAGLIILLCYLNGFFWALCPVLGWSSYQLEAVNVSCSIHWESTAASDVSYCLSLTLFAWFLPLATITYSYVSICALLRRESRKSIRRNLRSRQKRKQMSRERSVAITVLFMIGTFVVSWMPYSIVSLMVVFGGSGSIPLAATTVPAVFAKSSIIWNPLIYVARHNDFRRACLKILSQCNIQRLICQQQKDTNFSVQNSLEQHKKSEFQDKTSLSSLESTTLHCNMVKTNNGSVITQKQAVPKYIIPSQQKRYGVSSRVCDTNDTIDRTLNHSEHINIIKSSTELTSRETNKVPDYLKLRSYLTSEEKQKLYFSAESNLSLKSVNGAVRLEVLDAVNVNDQTYFIENDKDSDGWKTLKETAV